MDYLFVFLASAPTRLLDKYDMLFSLVYVSLVAFSPCSPFHLESLPRDSFSKQSIIYDIQVTFKQAADIGFSRVCFEMINPVNVMKVFVDRASGLFCTIPSNKATTTATFTNRECEVADLLCGVLESIASSDSHTIDIETTLDHELVNGELVNDVDYEDTAEETSDPNWNDEGEHDDEDEEKALCKQFSLDYMTKAVNYYDEINPQKGKRKRHWATVKNHFRRIPYQLYLSRFRRYLEKHGTKKQKLDKIDDHVFDMFERAREKPLPVHDIDLRRWALKKAMDESLHNFVASSHWLFAFKHKHNITSRKITKVRDVINFYESVRSDSLKN